jgi:hypothetical protein
LRYIDEPLVVGAFVIAREGEASSLADGDGCPCPTFQWEVGGPPGVVGRSPPRKDEAVIGSAFPHIEINSALTISTDKRR